MTPPSNHKRLILIYLLLSLWLGLLALPFLHAPSWAGLPILLCWGAVTLRLLFEVTLNRHRVPTLATSFRMRQKIVAVLQKEANQAAKTPFKIIDLGSGRGGLAHAIAATLPNAEVTGVELARVPYLESVALQRLFGPRNLSYEHKDFWSFDCRQADAIVLYLAPVTAQKMGEKLTRELKPGCLVLSHTFPLGGNWTETETLTIHTPFKEKLHLYRHP